MIMETCAAIIKGLNKYSQVSFNVLIVKLYTAVLCIVFVIELQVFLSS
jgi:hypothetical protein